MAIGAGSGQALRPAAPVVGLLIDSLEDDYHSSILRGAVDAVKDRSANLLCFAGGSLGAAEGEGGERNGVFGLAGPASVDGLIVMSGAIGNRVGVSGLQAYCGRFRPLPMCSVGVRLEGAPSVSVDNEAGTRLAIGHLIGVHGKSRIAFIQGPDANAEAARRFAVYRQTLAAAGIRECPERVVAGNFEHSGGLVATRALLTERGSAGREIDAIVAANDAMALGALDALAQLGIGVPDRVAVVGFDDVEEARFAVPPLTTVRQPFYEQGADAVGLVLDQLERRAPSRPLVRSTELVTRSSCGCSPPPRAPGAAPWATEDEVRRQVTRRLHAESRARALARASAAIASAHDVDSLSRAVRECMPALGIPSCYVATFDASTGEGRRARLAIAHSPAAQRRETLSWQLRPAADILRREVLPASGGHAFAVLPTTMRGEELGIVALELTGGDEGYVYETVAWTLACSLARSSASQLR